MWARRIGGTGTDRGISITTDTLGNVYVTGWFEGAVDFNPGLDSYTLVSIGDMDIFVLKLDVSGNFMWARRMGGTLLDEGVAIATDASGNVIITGFFQGTVDFDPSGGTLNLVSAGGRDIFIQKLNSEGNLIWARRIGGTLRDDGFGIAADASGNVYTTGLFRGTVDFDPGTGFFNLVSLGADDIYVLKLDPQGNFLWVGQMGGTQRDEGRAISVDAAGFVYTTGLFQGTADFNPGTEVFNLISAGADDIFIQKLDSLGTFQWARRMGGPADDLGFSVITDTFGHVYATGCFQGTVDFDPGAATVNLVSNGEWDAFVLKLDQAGNFLRAKRTGGISRDEGNALAVDATGSVYLTGFFHEVVDFNPGVGTFNITSAGWRDIFVQKLNWCSSLAISVVPSAFSLCGAGEVTLVATGAAAFQWNDNFGTNDTLIVSPNTTTTYTVTGTSGGCFGTAAVTITVTNVDATTTLNGPTITANNPRATYQWLDCNNNFAPIAGQTARSFTAEQNGRFAVRVTENGCTRTSDCVAILNVAVFENLIPKGFKVYPNPTSGNIRISFDTHQEQIGVRLLSIVGEIIESKNVFNSSDLQLEITGPAGVYFIEITDGSGKRNIVRVVKE